jgi:hypothetical protein
VYPHGDVPSASLSCLLYIRGGTGPILTATTPTAPAAKNLGVGLPRPCRGGRMALYMGRWRALPPARPSTPRGRSTTILSLGRPASLNYASTSFFENWDVEGAIRQITKFAVWPRARVLLTPPCCIATSVLNLEPHTRERHSVCVLAWG